MDQLGHSPADQPLPGAKPDTEKELFAAMDQVAVALLQKLKEPLPADAKDADLNMVMKIMDRAQDWLKNRQKLKPASDPDDARGVDLMRGMMNEKPHEVVARFEANPAFQQALVNRGWLPPMKKKNGRPTKEEAAERAAHKAEAAKRGDPKLDDDSGLKALLGDMNHGQADQAD